MKQKDGPASELARKKAKQAKQVTSNIPSVYRPAPSPGIGGARLNTEPTRIVKMSANTGNMWDVTPATQVKSGFPGTLYAPKSKK